MRAGRAQGVFESLDIVVPELAFGVVRFADLPVAGWIVDPLLKARELLLLADM